MKEKLPEEIPVKKIKKKEGKDLDVTEAEELAMMLMRS